MAQSRGGDRPDRPERPRVVSLAPSATATLRALGAADQLVGATGHCAAPDVESLGGWLAPDYDRLADLAPDRVLTADPLQRDVRDELRERGYEVAHHEPTTLAAAMAGVAEVGAAVGRPDAGAELAARCRERLDAVREATPDDPAQRPVVYCEEWGDPPMAAGNWVPEVVEVAGGQYPFRLPGERSAEVTGHAVESAAPEHVVVHHCGRGERSGVDLAARGWALDAAVHAVDDALLNQPSPRLVAGAVRLAELLHADREVPVPAAMPRLEAAER